MEVSHDEVNKVSNSWFLASDKEKMKWRSTDTNNPKLKRKKPGLVRIAPLIRLVNSLKEWIKKEPSEHLKKLLKTAQDNLSKLREDC